MPSTGQELKNLTNAQEILGAPGVYEGFTAHRVDLGKRPRAVHLAIVGALLGGVQPVCAQNPAYPAKAIRFLVTSAPGGGVDTAARVVQPRLSEALGQPVIVENRPGAGGVPAGEFTAKSQPDGHTLMIGALASLAVTEFFVKNAAYNPLKDLAPVSSVISAASVLVMHPSISVRTVPELIALAKARPGELAYGSSGTGSAGHLAGALFQVMAKVNLLHVPYKGGAPAMVDLLAGQTQIGFSSSPTATPQIRIGRLKGLAVTTLKRSAILPELPTIAESGIPGYESNSWYGVVVAAKTNRSIIVRLNRELVQILGNPAIVEALLKHGLEAWPSTPEAFGAYIRSEHDKWGRIFRSAGITPA